MPSVQPFIDFRMAEEDKAIEVKPALKYSLNEHLQTEIDNIRRKYGIDIFEKFYQEMIEERRDPEYDNRADLVEVAEEIGKMKAFQEILDDLRYSMYYINPINPEEENKDNE